MSSNRYPPESRDTGPAWHAAGLHYYTYRFYLENRFGGRVQRISLDGGFTCPNVDGTAGTGGCVFCNNNSFSPSRRLTRRSIAEQLEVGIERLRRRYPNCNRYIAYFQPATNTYAPVENLRQLYRQALEHDQVVGLAIGTRPDCVPNEVLDLLTELAKQTYVSVEYGMQTIHRHTLEWMNRGHDFACMQDAARRSQGRGFEVAAHLVLGFPTETRAQMLETADQLAHLGIDAVKLHNLYVVQQTPLADQVRNGEIRILDRDEYVRLVADVLERLPPDIVIQRISGDAPARFLVAPQWCTDKSAIRRELDRELSRRRTRQGSRLRPVGERTATKGALP